MVEPTARSAGVQEGPAKTFTGKLPPPYQTGRQTRAFRILRDNTNAHVARENDDLETTARPWQPDLKVI